MLLVTNGVSNNKRQTLDEAQATRRAGITMITVGVGGWFDMNELNGVASYPYQSNQLLVPKFSALDSYRDPLANMLCNSKWHGDS